MSEEPINNELVQDPTRAHEIADLMKPGYDRDIALRKQDVTGLTQEESANTEIMDGLQEKYPNAFEVNVDDKGRKILTTNVTDANQENFLQSKSLMVNMKGIFSYGNRSTGLESKDLKLTDFIDTLADPSTEAQFVKNHGFAGVDPKIVLTASGQDIIRTPGMSVRKLDPLNKDIAMSLKSVFENAQARGIANNEKQQEFKAKADPKAILADL